MPLASGADGVNVVPAQAVPAAPVAGPENANTPGSGVGHVLLGVPIDPQERASCMLVTAFDSESLGGVLVFRTVKEPDTLFWPAVVAEGTVSAADWPTPAEAGPAARRGATAATRARPPTRLTHTRCPP